MTTHSDSQPSSARATLTLDHAAELAIVERSGFIESRHAGVAVVVDPDGAEVVSLGDPTAPVLTRSCLKPLQAIAVLETGVALNGPELVLASASHRAESRHIDVVERMLREAGLTATDLQCPSVLPADPTNRRRVGDNPSPVFFNCSGKHAAFLAAQVHAGEPTDAYLDPDSFIQQRVRQTVTEYCGEAPAFTGIDGCGAPVHAVSLTALARGVSYVTAGRTLPGKKLVQAVLDNPWAIQGQGKANTVAIEQLGVFAKFGAEGVLVMGTREGYCVAVKALDGSGRATTFVALELLAHIGALDAREVLDVLPHVTPAITGGTNPDGTTRTVGSISAGADLYAVLQGRA